MPKLIEMVGRKFNKLLVLRDSGLRGLGIELSMSAYVTAEMKALFFGEPLRRGHTKSCGCDKKLIMTKHGKYGCGAYKSWG